MIDRVSGSQYHILNKNSGKILEETKLGQMSFLKVETTCCLDPRQCRIYNGVIRKIEGRLYD
ncbi:MAG: hypothetical protein PVI95_03320 [Dehalococcoidia bacterium]